MNAMPMVIACALGQGNQHQVNTCHCGEEKRLGYWQCPTCALRDAVEFFDRLPL